MITVAVHQGRQMLSLHLMKRQWKACPKYVYYLESMFDILEVIFIHFFSPRLQLVDWTGQVGNSLLSGGESSPLRLLHILLHIYDLLGERCANISHSLRAVLDLSSWSKGRHVLWKQNKCLEYSWDKWNNRTHNNKVCWQQRHQPSMWYPEYRIIDTYLKGRIKQACVMNGV